MIDANGLKTFKISNGALKNETLPRRLKFLAWGDNKSTDGNYRAGDKTGAELSANQKKFGFERVAIDFNHCSVPGTDTYNDLLKVGQPPLIFGYGRVQAVPEDGIYLEDIIWTPLGVQHARNFEDLSPAIQDEDGEVTLVHSVALTPNGKVEGLEFFNAALKAQEEVVAQPKEAEEKDMTLLSVTRLLGLPETTEEKTVLQKLTERLQVMDAEQHARIETVNTLNARIKTLEESLKKTVDDEQAAERIRIVTLLSTEVKSPKREDGPTYSREELLALDLATLRLLHANTPTTVPLSPSAMTSQIGEQWQFVSKDDKGNLRVDLAGIFNRESQRTGQGRQQMN